MGQEEAGNGPASPGATPPRHRDPQPVAPSRLALPGGHRIRRPGLGQPLHIRRHRRPGDRGPRHGRRPHETGPSGRCAPILGLRVPGTAVITGRGNPGSQHPPGAFLGCSGHCTPTGQSHLPQVPRGAPGRAAGGHSRTRRSLIGGGQEYSLPGRSSGKSSATKHSGCSAPSRPAAKPRAAGRTAGSPRSCLIPAGAWRPRSPGTALTRTSTGASSMRCCGNEAFEPR